MKEALVALRVAGLSGTALLGGTGVAMVVVTVVVAPEASAEVTVVVMVGIVGFGEGGREKVTRFGSG